MMPFVRVVICTLTFALCLCACAKKPAPVADPEPYRLYVDKREVDYDHPRKAFFINDVIEEDGR
jgi:hypothetical protein